MKRVVYIFLYLLSLAVLCLFCDFSISRRLYNQSCDVIRSAFGGDAVCVTGDGIVCSLSGDCSSFWEMELRGVSDDGDKWGAMRSRGWMRRVDLYGLVSRTSNDRYVLTRNRNFLNDRPSGYPGILDTLEYGGGRFVVYPVAKWSVKKR